MTAIFRLTPSDLKALLPIQGSRKTAKIQTVIASQPCQLPDGQRLGGVVCWDIAFLLSAHCHPQLEIPKTGGVCQLNHDQEPLFSFPIVILVLVRTKVLVSEGVGLTFLFTISQMNSKIFWKILNPSQIPCRRAGGESSSVQRALTC